MAARRRPLHEDTLLALTVLLRHRGKRPPDLRTCVEATERGWWYAAPVRAEETVVMFFTDRREYARGVVFGELVEDAPLIEDRTAGATVTESRVLSARSGLREPLGGAGWLAVGDSASSYDPVSGSGIHKALAHGALAAGAVHGALRGDTRALGRYMERVRTDFGAYARARRAVYESERRWEGAGFWTRRLQSFAPARWEPEAARH